MSQHVCTVEYRTESGGIAHHVTEVDAPDGATASERANETFQSQRPGDCLEIVEIVCEERH